MQHYYMYIVGNSRPTIYIGVTNDLIKRVIQHKQGTFDGFTKRYELHMLLYYEIHYSIEEAILREKQLKHWNRLWKINLIKQNNPTFKDLYPTILP